MMTFEQAQRLAWENKLAHGFSTADVPLEFMLLVAELAEAFDAWRKQTGNAGEELADTAIFVLGLAQMLGFDLQQEVERKLKINAARVYRTLENGMKVKDQ